jgi:plastocyanin
MGLALVGIAPDANLAAWSATRQTAKAITVTIEGLQFSPDVLRVRAGQRVTWINKDPFPHTVTARNGSFDSHAIAPDGSWTYVVGKAGDYDYICTFHPSMKGRLEVR